MRKNLAKILVSVMSATILFNSVACGKTDKNSEIGGVAPSRAERVNYKGIHQYNQTESGKYIIQNGQCDYKIVVPAGGGTIIGTAKNELKYFIKEATGVDIPSISDLGLEHNDEQKYLSLGDTTLFETSNIKKDERLGHDGAQIVTKGNTIYFIGDNPLGVLNAVYTFLQMSLNFDTYWKDCYSIDKNIKDLKLMNYDVVDIPDVAYRSTSNGPLSDLSNDYNENNYASRLRYSITGYPLMPIYKEFDNPSSPSAVFHNTSECLPVETYGEEHPKWFGDGTVQLCYTAHGDDEEFELMAQEAAKKVENSLKIYSPDKYPEKNTISISVEDGAGACKCEACQKSNAKYHSNSGAIVVFINRVGEIVEEWMKQPENDLYKRDDFHIIFFAYSDYTVAPAIKDDNTGKWNPIDEKVKMRDNVGVYLAPINNFDNQQSIYAELNNGGRDNVDAWSQLTDALYLWTYATNFTYYMYMYDSFSFYNEAYNYIASKQPKFIYNQMQWDQKGASTAWHTLKCYLDGNCYWDSTRNTKELTDKYFKAMYREAAPIMQSLYNDMRIHTSKVMAENDFLVLRSIYNKVDNREMWPLLTLLNWTNKCDEAINVVSMYKDVDNKLYESLVNHIEMEWLSPAFITLSLYSNYISQEDKIDMINRFERVVNKLGMTNISEGSGGLVHAFDGIK